MREAIERPLEKQKLLEVIDLFSIIFLEPDSKSGWF